MVRTRRQSVRKRRDRSGNGLRSLLPSTENQEEAEEEDGTDTHASS